MIVLISNKGNGPVDGTTSSITTTPCTRRRTTWRVWPRRGAQEPPWLLLRSPRHTPRPKERGRRQQRKLFPYARGAPHLRVPSGAHRADGARGDSLARGLLCELLHTHKDDHRV